MFGAGEYARDILSKMDSVSQIYDDDDIVFCDNNPSLWGGCLEMLVKKLKREMKYEVKF